MVEQSHRSLFLKYSILYVSEIVIENKIYKCLNLEKFGVELKVKW